MIKMRAILAAGLVVAAAAGGFVAARILPHGVLLDMVGQPDRAESEKPGNSEREIAYWVAPMDPDYRRDEPGKSPMGMDLIPVYEGEAKQTKDDAPALEINPAIVNNLGVRTAEVRRGALHRRIETVGFVVPDEDRQGHVHVRTEGWIEELFVKSAGERVGAGDPLFSFYSPALVNAQAEYLQARAHGNQNLRRASRARLLALGLNADQIAGLSARGEIRQEVTVHAHHAGTVLKLGVRDGMFVRPEDMIMDMSDLSSVWVMVEVFGDAAAWIAEGQVARMRIESLPGRQWKGRVDYVYPLVDPQSRAVRVRLVFENADRALKPNMYADVTIEADPREALHMPRMALIRGAETDRVILALGEGRFRPADVVPGIESGDRVEIREGLDAGERVVISAQFLLDSEASRDAALLRLSSPAAEPPPPIGMDKTMDMDESMDMGGPMEGHDNQPAETAP